MSSIVYLLIAYVIGLMVGKAISDSSKKASKTKGRPIGYLNKNTGEKPPMGKIGFCDVQQKKK
jgi:hypothetical protein